MRSPVGRGTSHCRSGYHIRWLLPGTSTALRGSVYANESINIVLFSFNAELDVTGCLAAGTKETTTNYKLYAVIFHRGKQAIIGAV